MAEPLVARIAPTAPAILFLFILSMLPPSYFFLGDLRLSPTRLLLLVTFIPLLLRLLAGKAGRIRAIDILLMLFMAWMVITLVYHHGVARFPYAVMSMVEMFGGYLIGRVLVRNEADYRALFHYVLWAMLFLVPFVVVELLTNLNVLQELSEKVLPTYFKGESSYGRIGLNRVMVGFEHPILYGLFCAAAFAPIVVLIPKQRLMSFVIAIFVSFMTFASLSSAPLLAIALQIGLLAWAWATGGRWWLLVTLIILVYITIDLLSNRTPITILMSYLTFDPATAWTRVLTWEFGSAEVWRHPLFGIGLNDFLRPDWLTPSVDNFWLLIGMRHGAIGAGLMLCSLTMGLWAVMKLKLPSGDASRIRSAYIISIIAVYFTLCTVHIWGATSSYVMALIGAGIWLCDRQQETQPETVNCSGHPSEYLAAQESYSRFANTHQRSNRTILGRNLNADTTAPLRRHNVE